MPVNCHLCSPRECTCPLPIQQTNVQLLAGAQRIQRGVLSQLGEYLEALLLDEYHEWTEQEKNLLASYRAMRTELASIQEDLKVLRDLPDTLRPLPPEPSAEVLQREADVNDALRRRHERGQ